MKTRKLGYWTTTTLLALYLLAGGTMQLSGAPEVMATLAHVGYPVYFATLLGVWKLLGAAAIAAPRLPRVKEWAYAGCAFTFSGAVISHALVGDGVDKLTPPLVLLLLTLASWALRPEDRRLAAATAASNDYSAVAANQASAIA